MVKMTRCERPCRILISLNFPELPHLSHENECIRESVEDHSRFRAGLCLRGSTYLGIGIAVEQIPPALMCGSRFLTAGTVMLAYCALTGRRIRFSVRQLGHFAAVGILLLMGGNLTLAYAERIVPTGLAALLIAVTPLWFLVLDSLLLGDHHISRRGKIGLTIGIAGVVVLIWPDLQHSNSLGHRELWWSLGLQLGSFSWAFGSVLSKRWQTVATDPFGAIAWQMFFAGVANSLFALLVEDLPTSLGPSAEWPRFCIW